MMMKLRRVHAIPTVGVALACVAAVLALDHGAAQAGIPLETAFVKYTTPVGPQISTESAANAAVRFARASGENGEVAIEVARGTLKPNHSHPPEVATTKPTHSHPGTFGSIEGTFAHATGKIVVFDTNGVFATVRVNRRQFRVAHIVAGTYSIVGRLRSGQRCHHVGKVTVRPQRKAIVHLNC
jgi:hypothetical protein